MGINKCRHKSIKMYTHLLFPTGAIIAEPLQPVTLWSQLSRCWTDASFNIEMKQTGDRHVLVVVLLEVERVNGNLGFSRKARGDVFRASKH